MPLNDLSLDELTEIAGTLEQIRDAGVTLAAYGLNPTFNLTPGQPATITLPFEMPEAPGHATKADVARIEAKLDQRLEAEKLTIHWVQVGPETYAATEGAVDADAISQAMSDQDNSTIPTPSTEAAQPEPALEPVDAPLAAGDSAGGAPISADAHSRSDDVASPPPEASPPPPGEPAIPQADTSIEGTAESGGGAVMAATPPAATHQEKLLPATWSEDEDTRLVAGIVAAMVGQGLIKSAAIRAMAAQLGRPEQGTAFRVHHKLKARLDDALAAAQTAKAEAEALLAKSPATEPTGTAQWDAAVGGDTPAAVQDEPDLDARSREAATAHGNGPASFTADPVTAHLMALTDKGGWTVERDHELMELSIAGWHPNEIALQLQMQASAIKPRFDALTGQYTDDSGKKARRFTREDVYAALTRLAGKHAPDTERGAA